MQGYGLFYAAKMQVVLIICSLRSLYAFFLEGMVDHSAYEGGELEVTLGFACSCVDESVDVILLLRCGFGVG